jgi:hypothetical protein
MIAEAKGVSGSMEAQLRIENVSGSNYHDVPDADFGF